jgi:ATP-dependent Clp protease ATP-binding subunit ClpC
MWEPFSEGARRAIVLAQEVAQMFASNFIGNEHIAFTLAEGDNEVGHLLAAAIDRDAIKARLGTVGTAPTTEMVFSRGAKRTIELAFINARRLDHDHINTAHLALGLLESSDPPPLLPTVDAAELRTALETAAKDLAKK